MGDVDGRVEGWRPSWKAGRGVGGMENGVAGTWAAHCESRLLKDGGRSERKEGGTTLHLTASDGGGKRQTGGGGKEERHIRVLREVGVGRDCSEW